MKKAILSFLLFSILLISSAYAFPSVSNVNIFSGNGLNTTKANLTVTYDATNSFVNTTDWRINNVSFARINLPFEANNGSESNYTLDRTTFNNNGTVIGATWSATSGHDGKGAYFFDGVDDYINAGNSSSLESPNAWTVEFWANVSAGPSFPVSIDRRGSGGNNFYVWRFGTGTWVVGFLKTGGGFQDVFFSSGVTVGAWQHFAFVFDDVANTMKYYKDGILQATNSVTTSPDADGDQTLFIGVRGVGGDHYKGWLDDIRIYNRAISSAQVLADKGGYNLIAKQSLTIGQNWTACVTPNDGIQDGTTVCSANTIQIVPANLSCVEPEDGLSLNNNTLFCSGIFDLTTGMTVNASNVVVGCNQTTIVGVGTGNVFTINSKNNVTIQDCSLSNFAQGISPTSSHNNTFMGNTIANCQYGIFYATSHDNILKNNIISGGTFGSFFSGANRNIIFNNTYTSLYGTYFTSSNSNMVLQNNMNSSSGTTLVMSSESNSRIINNSIRTSGGAFSGAQVDSSNNITISGNIINGGERGLVFYTTSNSFIFNNQLGGANDFGLRVAGNNNQIYNNNISNNNRKGLRIGEPFSTSTNNFVFNNIFFANPIGIMITGLTNSTFSNNSYDNTGSELNTTDGSASTFIQSDSGSELKFQNTVILIKNIDNIFISTAIVGLNTTLEPQMNTSANITLHSSETGISCSNYVLKTNPSYIKSLSDAKSSLSSSNCTGSQCSAVSCSGSTGNIDVTFNVKSFSTYFLDFTPATQSQFLTGLLIGLLVTLYILLVGVVAYSMITSGGFGFVQTVTILIMLVMIPVIVELARSLFV